MNLSFQENVLYAAIAAIVICFLANIIVTIIRISKRNKFDADFAKFLTSLKDESVQDNSQKD